MGIPSQVDAIVIGSGFAGCSAAVRLAESGRKVAIVEEAPRLGGRASSFLDRETGERVDNGQHALFGCYRDTYDFLRRIGAADEAPLQGSLTLSMAGHGRVTTLSCPSLPAPWHLFAGLMKWNAISLSDRFSALRLARLLRDGARRGGESVASRVTPTQTVSEWLIAHGQSPALREWLWNPLAIAAMNQSPDHAAAAPFVRVLCELFAPNRSAAAIGLPTVPLDDLYANPTTRFVESRGGVLVRGSARVALSDSGAVAGIRVDGTLLQAPVVVSTVPWHAFARLWDHSVPAALERVAKNAGEMADCPIVTVNLWCGQPVTNELPSSFVGLVDGPMHWVFHKGQIFGGSATHLSIVASGAIELLRLENAAITSLAVDHLTRALPALRRLEVRRSVVVREPRATFSLAPGSPPRPGTRTAVPGLFLAGDWTDTGLPGTIESAVRSGYAAAEAAGA